VKEIFMSNPIVTFFQSIGNWFKKVFKNVPAWNVVALSTLNTVAPLFETVFALVDPGLAAIATPIITEIQTDLGTVSQLLTSANTANLTTLLNAIKANFSTLASEAHITNPTSLAQAQAAEATITSELEAIIAAVPAS
jgi:hypothetical protein